MKERGILFNGSMVRAILKGSKTQTRRAVKPSTWNPSQYQICKVGVSPDPRIGLQAYFHDPEHDMWCGTPCPYGQIGDHLWVRETWQHSNHPYGPLDDSCDIFYREDYLDDPLGADLEHSEDGIRRTWKPSIHMPRIASRIQLEITGVRVERLQDISEADAIAEGITRKEDGYLWERGPISGDIPNTATSTAFPRIAYQSLWESINGPGSWDANPWVWVIEFRRAR